MPEVQSKPARGWLVVGLVVLLGGLGTLAAGGDFRRFTSYVGRRVQDREQVRGVRTPLAANLHSRDGAEVGFADGRVEWLDRAALGLGPDDPIVAGPTSRSPILRLLSE